jgi:putative toxin-antitoxin system antitoxin component (TIGR02293 family)
MSHLSRHLTEQEAAVAEEQHKSGRPPKLGLDQALGEATRRAVKQATREQAATQAALEVEATFKATMSLLGGRKVIGAPIESELDAHEMLRRGLPRGALTSLIDKLHVIHVLKLSEVLGVSLRTLQRHKAAPVVHLDVQQSGRAWKFAEILAKATRVLGSQDEAEQWLERPAIGLDQQRPIDLLTTPAGVNLVEDYLGRLEYGVYT